MTKRSDVCAECKVRFRQTGSSLCWWCQQGISPQDERDGSKARKQKRKSAPKRPYWGRKRRRQST